MITENDDKLISKVTVRLKKANDEGVIGTGVIYYQDNLKDNVYIITTAHSLYKDLDEFQDKYESIEIDFLNATNNSYKSLTIENVDENLISKSKDSDYAVLILEKEIVENLIGEIPKIKVVREKLDFSKFICKGFPMATMGKELDAIFPIWKQRMTEVDKFQLELRENYSEFNMKGFSGGGTFIAANGTIYLYGMFTRFREEEKGNVIYCQYTHSINHLLQSKYLPTISFDYLGKNNLTKGFFESQVNKAVINLGPRFSKQLNFKLPIAKLFNDLAFDNDFKFRFQKVFDIWLLESIYNPFSAESDLNYLKDKYLDLKLRVKTWVLENSYIVGEDIDYKWIEQEIKAFNAELYEEERKLYDLQYEEEKKNKEENKSKKTYSHRRPYENEIHRLSKIQRTNRDLLYNLDEKINISVTNNPILIIDGEAGSGKSHLMGDIASRRIESGLPTLLFLGQNFNSSNNVENNIIQFLDVNCTFSDLLDSLNDIGKQIGERIIILIDAINEGPGAKLWRDQLHGVINEVLTRPYIGLCVSIRTTYIKSIITESLKEDDRVNFIKHEGFKGNEYAALKMFCDFHNLKQPSFPILSPEFTNPLFLKIICEGVKNSVSREFPQGFQGVQKVFDLFLKSIDVKLEEKRDLYKNRNITNKVIKELAFKIFESDYKRISLEEANQIMDCKFSRYPNLLSDLIEESILIKNIYQDHSSDEENEVVYFAYERFGDFYLANELLKKYKKKEEVYLAFQKDSELGKLLEDSYYMHDGILEALATILPEKYDLEIFEVFNWIYEKVKALYNLTYEDRMSNHDFHSYRNLVSWLNGFFLDSLNWRTVDSIDDDKITTWFKKDMHSLGDEEWFLKLVELTAVKDHPFNSDRLHRILKRYSMAERDSFWQIHLRWYNGHDDDNNGFPIRRLIDWAWRENISGLIDEETARLCGQTLSWVLSSTNRVLRDQTTKALVNLLENQSGALIKILKAFENNDDFYIKERLYAIAYGCVLRTEDDASIVDIASYVYDLVFKDGNPPTHILLRDYARNIIEYCVYKEQKLDFDLSLVRPPYNTKLPKLPSIEEIAKYDVDNDSKEFDKEYGHVLNHIYFQVIEWDFGTKTVEPEFKHFYPISFKSKNEYKEFKRGLSKKKRKQLKSLKSIITTKTSFKRNKRRHLHFFTEEQYKDHINTIEKLYEKIIELINDKFNGDELDFIKNTLIPYFQGKAEMKEDRTWYRLNSQPFKRWIVQRVFELGYDVKLHGNYDKNFSKYGSVFSDETERIGEKYQWISLHEILAIVADNFKIKNEDFDGDRYSFYDGPWQLYTRDIDPIATTKIDSDKRFEDVFELDDPDKKEWWFDVEYNFWNKSNLEWSESIEDLPNIEDLLIKTDNLGQDWFFIEYFPEWREPKRLGEEKYMSDRKDLSFGVRAYLVENENRLKLLKFLKGKNLDGDWMPRNQGHYSKLFNREKFWSPAYNSILDEQEWRYILDKDTGAHTDFKIMVSTTNAKGIIDKDKSGANYKYDIPCKTLFKGLNLKYSSQDGDFINEHGELIVTNVNRKGTLIKKKSLIKYLEDNNLSIVWTVIGSKVAKSEDNFYHYKVPSGVYYLNDDKIEGDLKMFCRDD
ncbi:AVAST type 2 anti-phage system protein Avs2 [Winogradskyella poriferorum]|uniref:AVAST type 2 anti-phage system protein Avs2 n=1 Tax=Winogradskyella poriferorum TaxID=307627 RepID=A0ABU7W1K5_9FLAO